MEVWYIGADGSVQGLYGYQGDQWQNFTLVEASSPHSASQIRGIVAVSRIPTSMEVWYVGSDGLGFQQNADSPQDKTSAVQLGPTFRGSGPAMAAHVRHPPSGHDEPGQYRDSTVGIRKPPRTGRVPNGYKWRRLVHLVDHGAPRIAATKKM